MGDDPAPDPLTDPVRAAWRRSYAGLAAIGVFSVFINILRLATPFYVLQILDRVIASRSVETLIMLTVITLAAIVVGVLLEIVRRRMFGHWGGWIERSFGPRLFAAGLKAGAGKSANTSKALRDVSTVRSFVSGSGLVAWLDIVWAPLFIGCVFLISPPLGWITLIATAVTLVLGTLNELVTREARDAGYEARKDDREWIASAERNRESLGSLNMVSNLVQHWSRSATARLDEGMRTQSLNVYFSSTMRLVGRFLRIGMMGFGVWLVISEVLTLGAVVAANVLGRTAYRLVQNAMLKWRDMKTAKRAYQRIKTSLYKDTTARISLTKTNSPCPLVIEHVNYRYTSQARSVFRGIDVTVNPGEVLCVIGSSATGKTTLSRLVGGAIAPRSGKIRLGDIDVFRLQQDSVRREIGVLPQDYTLFRTTVRENIARMAEGDIGQVVRAAKLVGIHETILRLPAGYDTEIAENEPLLSAGQRKGVALARAFYGSPPLIVMDEPMPHLDRYARSTLMDAIAQVRAEGAIVVVTTQSRSLSKIANKAILFRDGKVEVLNTADEVATIRGNRRRRHRKERANDPDSSGTVAQS